jgi:hypothetical protein
MDTLDGRIALITGGIGAAAVRPLTETSRA